MIANIKTRVDFVGIVNYANDQKNKKKMRHAFSLQRCLYRHQQDHRRLFSDTGLHASESEKSGKARVFGFFTA